MNIATRTGSKRRRDMLAPFSLVIERVPEPSLHGM